MIVNDLENGHIAGGTGGSNITFVGPVAARTFRSDRASNVVVDNWNVDCNGCNGVQIFHLEAADNVVVRNSEIQDNNNNSLMWVSGSNLTFENNRIHDAGLPSGSGAHTECLYAWNVTNLTLKRNHFYHCAVMDVFITAGATSQTAASSRTTSSRNPGRHGCRFEHRLCVPLPHGWQPFSGPIELGPSLQHVRRAAQH